MTEQDFIGLNPSSFFGSGCVNLLYSSSVVNPGVDDTPVLPFHIQALTIPFNSQENIDVEAALKEVDSIVLDLPGGAQEAIITARQKRTGYFFFRIQELIINSLPAETDTSVGEIVYRDQDSVFIFTPYVEQSFTNNDYNPLLNNTNLSKYNAVAQVVDRNTEQIIPTNLQAILSNTATPAQIQNCSYTKAGIINSKYNGSKLTSGSIPGDDPALTFKVFKGSLHQSDANTATIKAIQLSDREVDDIYFTPLLSGSHPTKKLADFPELNSYIYTEEDNRLVRKVSAKIFSTDKGLVYTTDELGEVITIA